MVLVEYTENAPFLIMTAPMLAAYIIALSLLCGYTRTDAKIPGFRVTVSLYNKPTVDTNPRLKLRL